MRLVRVRSSLAPALLLGLFFAAALTGPARAAASEAADLALTRQMGAPYYSGAILPAPQQITERSQTLPLLDGATGQAHFEFMLEYHGPARDVVERLFQRRIQAFRDLFTPEAPPPAVAGARPILFTVVGDPSAAHFVRRFGLEAQLEQLQPQGYLLDIRDEGILCIGADNAGIAYGMASLIQLTHIRQGQLHVDQVQILDHPVYQTRWAMDYRIAEEELHDWMVLYKINGYASGFRVVSWEGLTANQRTAFARLGQQITDHQLITHMPQIHIGGRRPMPAFDAGDPDHLAALIATVREVMALTGSAHIMLCADDIPPELAQPREIERFSSQAEAYGFVAEQVLEHVREQNPQAVVSFVPPFYQGLKHRKWRDAETAQRGRDYLAATQSWHPDIWLSWTGPLTAHWSVTHEDLDAYRALIGADRPLLYWDNSWEFHMPLCNFYTTLPLDFVEHSADRSVFLCVILSNRIAQFHVATAVGAFWNPAGFDATAARDHGVIQFLGRPSLAAAHAFYDFRGDGYNYHFDRMADLTRYRRILEELEAVSWDEAIVRHCWQYFENTRQIQESAP